MRPTNLGRGRLFYDRRSMHVFAILLSRQLRQPVIDRTGLAGLYDFRLECTADDSAGTTADGAPLPDIFQAVEQQLGLHLEWKNTPIEAIAIDRAERVPIVN